MNLKKRQHCKNGNIIIAYSLAVFLVIIILFCISILYVQIDIKLKNVNKNLPVIVQNVAVLNCDKAAIKNFYYEFDMGKLKEDLSLSLKTNYNNVQLEDIYYDYDTNNFVVKLEVKIEPILNIKGIEIINVHIVDEVKFKVMEVLNKEEI